MKYKTIYSIVWYTFIGCFFVWLICGLGYRFLFNDKVEQSRMELTQALNAAFPREHYIIDGSGSHPTLDRLRGAILPAAVGNLLDQDYENNQGLVYKVE